MQSDLKIKDLCIKLQMHQNKGRWSEAITRNPKIIGSSRGREENFLFVRFFTFFYALYKDQIDNYEKVDTWWWRYTEINHWE
jgi:hypothetical protein